MIDWCPVTGLARPACRVGALGVLVDLVPVRQDRDILPAMTLAGCDEADRAVAMFLGKMGKMGTDLFYGEVKWGQIYFMARGQK